MWGEAGGTLFLLISFKLGMSDCIYTRYIMYMYIYGKKKSHSLASGWFRTQQLGFLLVLTDNITSPQSWLLSLAPCLI